MKDCREKALGAGLLWLRILAGGAIAYIGYGKVFGGQIGPLTEGVKALGFPAPAFFAWLAALSEFAGGLLIMVGFGTRIAASFLFITMCVAYFGAHAKDAFPMKIPAFLFGVISGALALTGAGRYSLDHLWCRRCCKDNGECERENDK